MRFRQLWALSSWCAVVALAAPSQKPQGEGLMQEFVQGNAEEHEDHDHYPMKEIGPDRDDDNSDYDTENEEHAKHQSSKSSSGPLTEKPKKSKDDFKTICEDKTGKCASGQSETSLEELLRKIRELLKHDKMSAKDQTELRSLFSELEERIREKCGDGINGPKPVIKIEEHHKLERVFETKEHHDMVHKEEIPPRHSHEAPPPPVPKPKPIPKLAPPPKPTDHDHFESIVPEVNYNGGFPASIDELKQKYPQGYWPQQQTGTGDDNLRKDLKKNQKVGDNSASVQRAGDFSSGSKPKASLAMGANTENINDFYYDDTDTSTGNDIEDATTTTSANANKLSPEFLERIIKQERNQSRTENKPDHRKHHVAEHTLPPI